MMRDAAVAIRQLQIVISRAPIRADLEGERHRPVATIAIRMTRRFVVIHGYIFDAPDNNPSPADPGDFERTGAACRRRMQRDRFAGTDAEQIGVTGKRHADPVSVQNITTETNTAQDLPGKRRRQGAIYDGMSGKGEPDRG
jgi:hypothetical protein